MTVDPGPTPGPQPRRRPRRVQLLSGIGILAVALTAGLTTWLTSGHSSPSVPSALDSPPVVAALDALVAAPEVRYQSTLPDGGAVDAQVTAHNDMVGTLTEDGLTFGLLRVAGKLYVKPPASGLPSVTNMTEAAAIKHKWLTGNAVTSTLGITPSQFISPPQLAAQLAAALADTKAVAPGAPLNGVRVLNANTPLGVLSVAQDQPYRIVRLSPAAGDGASLSSSSAETSQQLSGDRLPFGGVHDTAYLLDDAQETDNTNFPPEQPGEAANTYNELENETRQLSGAIDSDLQFNLEGSGQISCGDGGCDVTVTVTNTVSPGGSNAKIISGTVSAVLTATISIEGEPTDGCTNTGQLPLNDTGTISCSDPGAGGVFASVDAQKKAEAEAQSQAEDGATVPYTVNYSGEYYVYATAQVAVEQLVQEETREADAVEQQQDCGSNPAVSATEGTTKSSGCPIVSAGAPGVEHTLERHFRTGKLSAGKSLFADTESPIQLAIQAQRTPFVFEQGDQRFQFVVPDAGRTIGIDRATDVATSTYTVVTDANGNVVTMFPGLPAQLGTPVVGS